MKTDKIRIAFNHALTGLARLTTHGASSSTFSPGIAYARGNTAPVNREAVK
jgi:hypothetical protein